MQMSWPEKNETLEPPKTTKVGALHKRHASRDVGQMTDQWTTSAKTFLRASSMLLRLGKALLNQTPAPEVAKELQTAGMLLHSSPVLEQPQDKLGGMGGHNEMLSGRAQQYYTASCKKQLRKS